MLLLLYVTVTKLLKLIYIIFICNTIPTSDNIVQQSVFSHHAVVLNIYLVVLLIHTIPLSYRGRPLMISDRVTAKRKKKTVLKMLALGFEACL